jgi:hypothetical protein
MDKAFHDQIADILAAAHEMTLATVRPDGFPQTSTVSFVNVGFEIFFGCLVRRKRETLLGCAKCRSRSACRMNRGIRFAA